MTDHTGNGAGDPQQGQNQPHGEQGAVTPAQLEALRTQILGDVNGAIKSHLSRIDFAGPVRAAMESLQQAQTATPGADKKTSAGDPPAIQELRKQLEATNAALARERKSTAIRAALQAKGLSGTALEDAADALARRDDIKSEPDHTGRHIYRGSVTTELGPVDKPLDEVVGGYLQERSYLVPPTHQGGSGARGAGPGGQQGGGNAHTRLEDMSPEDMQANPDQALKLAQQALQTSRSTSPFG